jgi:hypothetical protein
LPLKMVIFTDKRDRSIVDRKTGQVVAVRRTDRISGMDAGRSPETSTISNLRSDRPARDYP